MNDELEGEPHFDLRVPERLRDLLVPVLEALKAVPPPAPDPAPGTSHAGSVGDTTHFVTELLSFALQRYGRGRRATVPHCLAVHVFFLATHGNVAVAEAIVEAAKARDEIANRFAGFFKDAGDLFPEKWAETLGEMIKSGRYNALGDAAQNRISVADCTYEFVKSFKRYLERRKSIDPRRKRRYASWLASLLPPAVLLWPKDSAARPGTWAQPATRLAFLGGAGALLAVGAIVVAPRACGSSGAAQGGLPTIDLPFASAGEMPQEPSTLAADSRAAVPRPEIPDNCRAMANGFLTKECITKDGDACRTDYAASSRLYDAAIRYHYDPRGLGDLRVDRDTVVPERYRDLWQDWEAREKLASLQSLHGKYSLEDSLCVVRQRLSGIATACGLTLESLDIHVIVAPVVRLDVELDRGRLEDTVRELRPDLLVLDPFVRLHRVDENVSAEVAPLLDFLRGLQRRHGLAVVLVHHARKGAAHLRAGQALRGSSELHAWGDSNLYLRRNADDELVLTVEHRAAASSSGLRLALAADGDALALQVIDTAAPAPNEPLATSPTERVEAILKQHGAPMTQREIRDLAKMRSSTIGDALAALVTGGAIARSDNRYRIVSR